MASASASCGNGCGGRIATAASTLYSDNQSLIVEIRRGLSMLKSVAVDLEKENQSEMVKELEDAVSELLAKSDDCTYYSRAIEAVGNGYQPMDELTDFKKVLEEEVAKIKSELPSVPLNNPFFRQFKEAVWNVHHSGQPLPGEEQEDVVMTCTDTSLLNITCPLSGKPVIELEDPVRSVDCKHIYEKTAVLHFINSKITSNQCPVAGCPKILVARRVVCDPFLLIEIDEMRSRGKESVQHTVVEDFTEVNED